MTRQQDSVIKKEAGSVWRAAKGLAAIMSRYAGRAPYPNSSRLEVLARAKQYLSDLNKDGLEVGSQLFPGLAKATQGGKKLPVQQFTTGSNAPIQEPEALYRVFNPTSKPTLSESNKGSLGDKGWLHYTPFADWATEAGVGVNTGALKGARLPSSQSAALVSRTKPTPSTLYGNDYALEAGKGDIFRNIAEKFKRDLSRMYPRQDIRSSHIYEASVPTNSKVDFGLLNASKVTGGAGGPNAGPFTKADSFTPLPAGQLQGLLKETNRKIMKKQSNISYLAKVAAEKQAFAGLVGAGIGGAVGAANLPSDATSADRARYASQGALRGGGLGTGASVGAGLGYLGSKALMKGHEGENSIRSTIATILPFLTGAAGGTLGYDIGDQFARNPGFALDDKSSAGDEAKADKREERKEEEKQGSDPPWGDNPDWNAELEAWNEKIKAMDDVIVNKQQKQLKADKLSRGKSYAATGGGALVGGTLANLLHKKFREDEGSDLERGLTTAAGGLGGGALGYGLSKLLQKKATMKKTTKEAALKSLVLEKIAESAAWQRKAGKNSEGGLNAKGRASYNKSTGGNLKAPVTSKKPKGKAKKRKASFCARMGGMKKKNTSKATANDPDSRINKSLRKWNC